VVGSTSRAGLGEVGLLWCMSRRGIRWCAWATHPSTPLTLHPLPTAATRRSRCCSSSTAHPWALWPG